jgi:hypothetical protein
MFKKLRLLLSTVITILIYVLNVVAQNAAIQPETTLTYFRSEGNLNQYVRVSAGARHTYTLPLDKCSLISPDGAYIAEVPLTATSNDRLIVRSFYPTYIIIDVPWNADWQLCAMRWHSNSGITLRSISSSTTYYDFDISTGSLVPVQVDRSPLPSLSLPDYVWTIPENFVSRSPIDDIVLYERCPNSILTHDEAHCRDATQFTIYDTDTQQPLHVLERPNPYAIRGRDVVGRPISYGGVAWSATGRYLAYEPYSDSAYDFFNLAVYDLDSDRYLNTDWVNATINTQKQMGWSPILNRLIFWVYGDIADLDAAVGEDAHTLVVFDATTEQFSLVDGPVSLEWTTPQGLGQWSPNGEQYAFLDADSQLQVANIISGSLTTVDNNVLEIITWQPEITPSPLITNITATSGRTYERGTLAVGQLPYTDRAYTFTQIPAALTGQEYIRTANADKALTGANFLTFTLTAPADVYVLWDNRYARPSWLPSSSWVDTGLTVTATDQTGTLIRRVYRRSYPAGTVSLNGNGLSQGVMYNVVAVRSTGSGGTATPTSTPTPTRTNTPPSGTATTTPTATATPPPAANTHRLNAGASASQTLKGITWSADNYFTGGQVSSYVTSIAGTDLDELFQIQRVAASDTGSFSYAIPVTSGRYTVRLYFAESWFTGVAGRGPSGTGRRVFDVQAEGVTILDNLDLNATVGPLTAYVYTLEGLAISDGTLNLNFPQATANRPAVAAIEVLPASAASLSITRLELINAVTDQVIDSDFTSGDVIDFSDIGTNQLSIRAVTSGSPIGSVRFGLDQSQSYRIENQAPYTIAGDGPGPDYYAWTPTVGSHILTVQPYAGASATGTPGQPLTVIFRVQN